MPKSKRSAPSSQLSLIPIKEIYTPEPDKSVEVVFESDDVQLAQEQIANLLDITRSAVTKSIADFKKERGNEINQHVNIVHMLTKDGRRRKVQVYDLTVLARIGFRAHANERVIAFQNWVGEILKGHVRTQNKRRRELTAMKAAGLAEHDATARLEVRIKGIDTLNVLKSTINRVCDQPNFGQMFNAEYKALFGKVASEIKEILNTKDIRESLPTLQLRHLQRAEEDLQFVLSRRSDLTMNEILTVINQVVRPLGEHLEYICELAGVDVVTGQALLGNGQH